MGRDACGLDAGFKCMADYHYPFWAECSPKISRIMWRHYCRAFSSSRELPSSVVRARRSAWRYPFVPRWQEPVTACWLIRIKVRRTHRPALSVFCRSPSGQSAFRRLRFPGGFWIARFYVAQAAIGACRYWQGSSLNVFRGATAGTCRYNSSIRKKIGSIS